MKIPQKERKTRTINRNFLQGSEHALGKAHTRGLDSSNGIVLILHELLIFGLQLAHFVLEILFGLLDFRFTVTDNLLETFLALCGKFVNLSELVRVAQIARCWRAEWLAH